MGQRLAWALGLMIVLAMSGWSIAAEGDAPAEKKDAAVAGEKTEKPKDELRVITGKLTAARQKLLKSKPELAEAYKGIRDKEKQLQEQIRKDLSDFYAKLRALSPEIDEIEKQKEAIEAERKKEQDAKTAAQKQKAAEGKKGGKTNKVQ